MATAWFGVERAGLQPKRVGLPGLPASGRLVQLGWNSLIFLYTVSVQHAGLPYTNENNPLGSFTVPGSLSQLVRKLWLAAN